MQQLSGGLAGGSGQLPSRRPEVPPYDPENQVSFLEGVS